MRVISEDSHQPSVSIEGLKNPADISVFKEWKSALGGHLTEVSYIENELARIRYLLYVREFPK